MMASVRASSAIAGAIVTMALSVSAGTQTEAAESLAELLSIPPLERLTATVERPLFVPGRRPPVVAPQEAEEPPVTVSSDEAPAELTGIVIGPEATYALLTRRDSEETELVRQGQVVSDWSVEEIGPRHVVLRRGTGRLRLELFDDKEKAGSGRGRSAEADLTPPRRRTGQQRTRPNPRGQTPQRPARRANTQRNDDDD